MRRRRCPFFVGVHFTSFGARMSHGNGFRADWAQAGGALFLWRASRSREKERLSGLQSSTDFSQHMR